MEHNNSSHHKSDMVLLLIVFAAIGLIFIAITILSFNVLKNVSGENWMQDLATKAENWANMIEDSNITPQEAQQSTSTTTNTSTTTSTSKTNVQVNTPQVTPQPLNTVCYRYPITITEFESNRCYSLEDYSILTAYLYEFQRATATKGGAEKSIEITCDGNEFFEDNCERSQAQKDQAEADIEKYRVLINEIIQKGK